MKIYTMEELAIALTADVVNHTAHVRFGGVVLDQSGVEYLVRDVYHSASGDEKCDGEYYSPVLIRDAIERINSKIIDIRKTGEIIAALRYDDELLGFENPGFFRKVKMQTVTMFYVDDFFKQYSQIGSMGVARTSSDDTVLVSVCSTDRIWLNVDSFDPLSFVVKHKGLHFVAGTSYAGRDGLQAIYAIKDKVLENGCFWERR